MEKDIEILLPSKALSLNKQVTQGRAGVGKIIFTLREPTSQRKRRFQTQAVRALRSIQAAYALLCMSDSIPSGFETGVVLGQVTGPKSAGNRIRRSKFSSYTKNQRCSHGEGGVGVDVGVGDDGRIGDLGSSGTASGTLSNAIAERAEMRKLALASIYHCIQTGCWERSLALWDSVRHVIPHGSADSSYRTIRFRVSAVRGGKHNFTSVELAGEVGAKWIWQCFSTTDLLLWFKICDHAQHCLLCLNQNRLVLQFWSIPGFAQIRSKTKRKYNNKSKN